VSAPASDQQAASPVQGVVSGAAHEPVGAGAAERTVVAALGGDLVGIERPWPVRPVGTDDVAAKAKAKAKATVAGARRGSLAQR